MNRNEEEELLKDFTEEELIALTKPYKEKSLSEEIDSFKNLEEVLSFYKGYKPSDIKIGLVGWEHHEFIVTEKVERSREERLEEGIKIKKSHIRKFLKKQRELEKAKDKLSS